MVRVMTFCLCLMMAHVAWAQDVKLSQKRLMLVESTVLSFFVTVPERDGKTPVEQLI